MAGLFCEPSREQLECGNPGYCIREDNGHLHSVFTWLCSLPQADITENVHVFKEFLNQFIAEIMFMTGHYRNLLVELLFEITSKQLTPVHYKTVHGCSMPMFRTMFHSSISGENYQVTGRLQGGTGRRKPTVYLWLFSRCVYLCQYGSSR